MYGLQCTGEETTLSQCEGFINGEVTGCTHAQDAGLSCLGQPGKVQYVVAGMMSQPILQSLSQFFQLYCNRQRTLHK